MLDATPLLRLYAGFRQRVLDAQDPAQTQTRQLFRLIRQARHTRFGRDHGLAGIREIRDFQAQVPLRCYEDFWKEYWESSFPRLQNCSWPGTIPFFALTSGTTTGVTKYIPCSRALLASNLKAGADLLVHHLANRPRSRLLAGKSFLLGGSSALTALAPGIYSGDLSGIVARTLPWWARLRYFPPRSLEAIPAWEDKTRALAARSLTEDIRAIGGVPSWLGLFFDTLADLHPASGEGIARYYPRLEMLIHGGVHFAPYRQRFQDLLQGSHAETREVYPASEGFIAVADRQDGEGLRLLLDTGLFFEFVPVEELASPCPTRHWIATVEPERNYALVLSTCAGLWAYLVGDTVRLIDAHPPRILITGRTSYTMSAFGEHLIAEEIEEAVAAAAAAVGLHPTDYAMGAFFRKQPGAPGGHLYLVEFAEGNPEVQDLATFARLLDGHLQARNADYQQHRAADYGLRPPLIQALAPGTFAAWMKSRGHLGGQHKVPRIINDPALFARLQSFAGCAAAGILEQS